MITLSSRIKSTLTTNRRGIATVYVALLLIAFIAFAGLAIDIGYMYIAKSQLQNAADSAALAGASRLNITQNYTFNLYTSAITESIKFASENKTANESVIVSSSLNSSVTSNVFTDGKPGNDIVVGNWSANRTPTFINAGEIGGTPVNAIQVRARRTSDSPGNSVAIFFGKIFGINTMPVSATATAVPLGLRTVGISLCTESCTVATPVNFELQEGPNPPATSTGMAWTAFSYTQAPDIGKNGDVVDLIWGRPIANPVPIDVCNPPLCITTNNGVGTAIKELDDAFKDTDYDRSHKEFNNAGKVTKWSVVVPILNDDPSCLHTPGTACPPGQQGNTNERYHVLKWAILDIADVVTTGNNKGVLASRVQCYGCINPPIRLPHQQSKLVKDR